MYGSLEMSGKPIDPLLPPPQTEERRRDFALRRQNAKRKVDKEEKPVLNRLFSEPQKKKKVLKDQQQQDDIVIGIAAQKPKKKKRSFLYNMMNPYSNRLSARIFKRCITTIILTDLFFYVLSTDPNIGEKHKSFFHITEGIVSSIFLVEYIARLIVVPESKKYGPSGPFWGRVHYACSVPAMIDLASAMPFFLEIPTGVNLPTLTYLRFFRLFRILKTEGFIRAIDAVYRVIYYNREILYVAAMLCLFLVMVTSVLLYYLRPQNEEDAVEFQSISATLYLSVMMLTGQGGPSGDMPWYTRFVVVLTSVFSVAMFAIPASMLTWGFEAEAERMARRSRMRELKRRDSNGESSESSEWFSDSDTTDEEYFQIIAGEDPAGGDESEETPWMKELREKFEQADADFTGTLSLDEFLKMQGSLDHQGGAMDAAGQPLEGRLMALERRVQENSEKLDRILTIVSRNGRGRR